MDMFKLLTRSSNIQRSTPAPKKPSSRPIPSNGFLSDEKDGTLFDSEQARSGGVKRKKSGVEDKQDNVVPGVLEDGAQSSLSLEKHDTSGTNGNLFRTPNVQRPQRTSAATPDLGKEQTWRTLKKHQLKFTILCSSSESQECRYELQAGTHSAAAGKKAHPQISPHPLTSFTQLQSKYGISTRLAENLDAQGYTKPSEVQMGSLPLLLGTNEDRGLNLGGDAGAERGSRADIDLLTIAPTGSGKTLGFMIHVLHGLLGYREIRTETKADSRSEGKAQALIIAPTHELADQIVNEGRKLASGTGIRISGLKKGMRLHPDLVGVRRVDLDTSERQINDFLVKTDIIVSTPLLLLHAISAKESGAVPLPDVRFLVLDEADVLLDPLFREQTLGIWAACTNAFLHTSLWSATMVSSIESLVQTFIFDRRRNLGLRCSSSSQHYIVRLVVGLKDSAIPNVIHRIIYAASEQGKLLALRQLLHPSGAPAAAAPLLRPPILVFTQTIPRAIALHSELLYDILPEAGGSSRLAVLHSDLSDIARSNTMAQFRKGEIWVLITTDLLSRGVDFRGLNGVVNYDIPNSGASYVHRIGRTGRQGREGGVAVTLYTKEDIPYMKNVANVIAASEKANKKYVSDDNGEGIQKWLLDALPNIDKKTKKALRKKGVEYRRVTAAAAGASGATKMRISTKSGYDRRLENKRKGALEGSRKRQAQNEEQVGRLAGEEWQGFGD